MVTLRGGSIFRHLQDGMANRHGFQRKMTFKIVHLTPSGGSGNAKVPAALECLLEDSPLEFVCSTVAQCGGPAQALHRLREVQARGIDLDTAWGYVRYIDSGYSDGYVTCYAPALHLCVDRDPAWAAVFKNAGANLEALCERGCTAFLTARTAAAVQALSACGARTDVLDDAGENLVHIAAREGGVALCAAAIEAGVDRHAVTPEPYGNNAMHLAAAHAKADMVQFLVSQGLSVEGSNKQGRPPLHVAIRYENHATYHKLLALGARPQTRNSVDGGTLLHEAAGSDKPDLCRKLVKQGFRVDERDNEGQTPLHRAAAVGACKASQAMVELGASLEATDHRERNSGLHWAITGPSQDLCLWMVDNGAPLDGVNALGQSPLSLAGERAKLTLCMRLAELGVPVGGRDAAGCSPLHHLLGMADKPLCLDLLERTDDIHAPDKRGRTLLHVAAAAGRGSLCRRLLARGVAADAQDDEGNTPLHQSAQKGHTRTSLALLEGGARPDVRNAKGLLPHECATEHGRHETADVLRSWHARAVARQVFFDLVSAMPRAAAP